ncbi:MAG: universal stress protein [Chloroflexota bacterium]
MLTNPEWINYLLSTSKNKPIIPAERIEGKIMFNPILVPLDGSPLAECVLPHVFAFARSFTPKIALLRIMEKKQVGNSAQLFDLLNWQINKTNASLYLEQIKLRLNESGLQAQITVLEGLEAEGITEFAQTQGMKLIILSSHGRNGLTQWGISNLTQKIILNAPTSLLIVRANQSDASSTDEPETMAYRRIMLPLDGSQRAENVLPIVTQLAHFHQSEVHLVQVVQTPEMARQMPPTPQDTDLSDQLIARNLVEAGHYLEQVKSRSYLEGLTVHTHLIACENAAVALHQLAEQEQIDLVTLSAHGYSGNHQWPYGSMVNNFILYGKVSLLIIQDQPAKQDLQLSESSVLERAER